MKKQIPILFSTMMVQATKAGRKTKTRRTTGLQEANKAPDLWLPVPHDDIHPGFEAYGPYHYRAKNQNLRVMFSNSEGNKSLFADCPYGKIGDILWVRETFMYMEDYPCADYHEDPEKHPRFEFKASIPDEHWKELIFKPSIHMPKEASRIWLEVTDIRVERLHDITNEDALAEGIQVHASLLGETYFNYISGYSNGLFTPVNSFETLWHKINGADRWKTNPWVWIISFKVLSTTGKPAHLEEEAAV